MPETLYPMSHQAAELYGRGVHGGDNTSLLFLGDAMEEEGKPLWAELFRRGQRYREKYGVDLPEGHSFSLSHHLNIGKPTTGGYEATFHTTETRHNGGRRYPWLTFVHPDPDKRGWTLRVPLRVKEAKQILRAYKHRRPKPGSVSHASNARTTLVDNAPDITLARDLPEPQGDIRYSPHKPPFYKGTFQSGPHRYTAQFEPTGYGDSHMFDFRQHGVEDEYGITGAGNAMATLSQVAAHFVHGLRKLEPKTVHISAEEPSRQKLYAAMLSKLARFAPEYTVTKGNSRVRGHWIVRRKGTPDTKLNREPHPAEGWVAEDGTHHPNEGGIYGDRHAQTLKRLGYPNHGSATRAGLMHVAVDDGEIHGHREDRGYTGPQLVTLKKLARVHSLEPVITTTQNGIVSFRPLKLSRHTAYGWITPDGTHHGFTGPADLHKDVAERLNVADPEAEGWMHVGSDGNNVLSGHHPDMAYTAPQLSKLKQLAREHKYAGASITTKVNGRPGARDLKLERYKAPSGGMVVNNQFYQGGKFLPRVFQAIKRVRAAKKLKLSRDTEEGLYASAPSAPENPGILADYLEEQGDPLHHVFRGHDEKAKRGITSLRPIKYNHNGLNIMEARRDDKPVGVWLLSDKFKRYANLSPEIIQEIKEYHGDRTALARNYYPDAESFNHLTDDPDILDQLNTAAREAPHGGLVKPANPTGLNPPTHYQGNIGGFRVRTKVPNEDSIDSSFDEATSTVLPGIRTVPMSLFQDGGGYASASDNAKVARLTELIRESKELNPLIAVKDRKGWYILEGGHRYDVLRKLGVKEFPAKVVVDHSDPVSLARKYYPDAEGPAELWNNLGDPGARGVLADYLEERGDSLHHVLRGEPKTFNDSFFDRGYQLRTRHPNIRQIWVWHHDINPEVFSVNIESKGGGIHMGTVNRDQVKQIIKEHHIPERKPSFTAMDGRPQYGYDERGIRGIQGKKRPRVSPAAPEAR